MTLWMVIEFWENDGDYEEFESGSAFRGVFDDRNKAIDAIRSIYDECKKDRALNGFDLIDYNENIEEGKITWFLPDEFDWRSYHVEYSVHEINVNEKYEIWR